MWVSKTIVDVIQCNSIPLMKLFSRNKCDVDMRAGRHRFTGTSY